MGKLRTSEVGYSPIPASERDVLRLQCDSEMLPQQASELIVVLDAPRLKREPLLRLMSKDSPHVRTHQRPPSDDPSSPGEAEIPSRHEATAPI